MHRNPIVISIGLAFGLIALIFSINHFSVQNVASNVLDSDPRNYGISASAHYAYWLVPTDIVFNLTDVSGTTSEADVTRVLFNFAKEMKGRKFDRVYLAFKGHTKFFLDGGYFQELGEQVPFQNPIFLIRTLPEHVKTLNGENAFGSWTGGLLGVMGKQMEDFNQFHRDWYLNDLLASRRN